MDSRDPARAGYDPKNADSWYPVPHRLSPKQTSADRPHGALNAQLFIVDSNGFINVAFAETVPECRNYLSLQGQDLENANACFQEVLSANPDDPEANFFYAVTRILHLIHSETFNQLLDDLGVDQNPAARNLYDWTADFARDSEGNAVFPVTTPATGDALAFLVEVLLPEIDGALSNLSKITRDTPFDLVLPPAETGAYDALEVDFGDIALYRTALYALKGIILIMDAYDVNVDDIPALLYKIDRDLFNINTDVLDAFAYLFTLKPDYASSDDDWDMDGSDMAALAVAVGSAQGDGNFNPLFDVAEPYNIIDVLDLTVFSGKFGGGVFIEAKQAIYNAINSYLDASDFIRNETDGQENDLLSFDMEDAAAVKNEQDVRNGLLKVQQSFSGPIEIAEDGIEWPFVLDLTHFFDEPIDLRTCLPAFSEDNDIIPYSFPDPTLSGILPEFNNDDWNNVLHLPVSVAGSVYSAGCK